jgi:hypothetical protein
MTVRLKDDFKIRDKNGDIIISLPSGSNVTPIRQSYLPKSAYENNDVVESYARTECYAIYLHSRYIFIPRHMCEIPKSEMFFYGDY